MTLLLLGSEILLPLGFLAACRLRGRPFSANFILAPPALLAPLALLFPWAAVPDNLGVGFGGPGFFWDWLTKYPNMGPINYEVLLGILCVTGASLLPAALAAYRLSGGRRRLAERALTAAALVVYVPVLIRLDKDLWLVGLLGAPTLLGRVAAPEAACGPLVRLLAVLATIAMAARAGRQAAQLECE